MLPDRRKCSEMALVLCCRLYLYLCVCLGLGAANSWDLVAAASAGLATSDGFGPPSLLRAATRGTLLARWLHRVVSVRLRLDDGVDTVHKVRRHSSFYASVHHPVQAACTWYSCVTPVDIIVIIVQPRLRHCSHELHLGRNRDCHSWSRLVPHHDSI